jgi:hypothetical protein
MASSKSEEDGEDAADLTTRVVAVTSVTTSGFGRSLITLATAESRTLGRVGEGAVSGGLGSLWAGTGS